MTEHFTDAAIFKDYRESGGGGFLTDCGQTIGKKDWEHLSGCTKCKTAADVLSQKSFTVQSKLWPNARQVFWEEVERYVGGYHPSDETLKELSSASRDINGEIELLIEEGEIETVEGAVSSDNPIVRELFQEHKGKWGGLEFHVHNICPDCITRVRSLQI